MLVVIVLEEHPDGGCARVAAPGLDSFTDGETGDDEPSDRIGPPPAEQTVQR